MKVFIVLLMFGWAGCTQQENVKFDPTKHEITAIDTVGVHWGWGVKGVDTMFVWQTSLWQFHPEDRDDMDSMRVHWAIERNGMTAIYELDTTFAPLRLPLFTTGELKKIKELLND